MLKPALQLKLGQQLTMTPQLQQAIRLLQLPVLELQAQVQEALESNVMLEAEEEEQIDLTSLDQPAPQGEDSEDRPEATTRRPRSASRWRTPGPSPRPRPARDVRPTTTTDRSNSPTIAAGTCTST